MLEHHRRMHKQNDRQDGLEMSPGESSFTTPDAAIPREEASQRLASFPARMHHSIDVDKASAINPTVDQTLGHMADITASASNDDTSSNATLNALRIKLDRLQKAKERAMQDFDQEISDVTIALKVVEETRQNFAGSSTTS